MKKILIFILILFASPVVCAQTSGRSTLPLQDIHLKDGTVLKGRLVGVSGDEYVISSSNLGQVRVKISEVANISAEGASPAAMPATASPMANIRTPTISPDMQQKSQQLLADPEVSAAMQELMKDPEALQLIQDPSVLPAAMSKDPEQIKNNAAVQKLLQNPKMQKLMEIIARKMGSQSP